MDKKILQIIALIISILTLIYLFLSYYGLIRYLKLYIYPTQSYIEKYKKLEKIDKNRVVICFTVEENQMKKMKPFLNSLLDQTVRVDDISLTLSNKNIDKVPEDCKKILSICGYNKPDNMICSILREREANTKIIIIEPGMIYGEDFIESIIKESEQNPNKIIKYEKGMLIKPKFFDEKVDNLKEKVLKDCCNAEEKIMNYSPIYKCIF